jgi:hypothetical protein
VLGLAAGAIILASLFPSGIADWLDWVFWGAVALAIFWGAPPAWAHQKESWRKRKERKKKKRELAEAGEVTHDDACAEAEVAPSEETEPEESSGEESPTPDKADDSESDEEAEGGKKDG